MSRTIYRALLLLMATLLAACASVPLMSLPKLAGLNPETVDMSQLELAVRLPDTVGIAKGTAKIGVRLMHEETGETLEQAMILSAPNDELAPFLVRKAKPGDRISRFKMIPEQAETAKLFRQKAIAMRAQPDSKGKIKMTLSASVGFCKYRLAPEFDAATMTFYVRTDPNKSFFTLFKEQTLQFNGAAKEAALNYCDGI